jgi:hypothetical protein
MGRGENKKREREKGKKGERHGGGEVREIERKGRGEGKRPGVQKR